MPAVQVAILAGGLGTRLGLPSPKPLALLADGRSMLQRQLDNIWQAFGDDARVTLVVGYRMDLLMEAFPDALFAYNEGYSETNTAVSLHKALRTSSHGGVLWFNGDVVFDAGILELVRPLIEADQTFACVNTAPVEEEEIKYTLDGEGCVQTLSKQVTDGLGEAVGINYISSRHKQTLIVQLQRCGEQDYFERGIELAIAENGMRVIPVDTSGLFVLEVNCADDLERANAEVSRTVTSAA
jgi:choline kinase